MRIHIVQKGDTLWKLAQKYGVDFESLKAANSNLSNFDQIMPGMKIKIPTGSVQAKKESQMPSVDYGAKKEKQIPKEAPKEKTPPPSLKEEKEQPVPMPAPPQVPLTQHAPSYHLQNTNMNFNIYKQKSEKIPTPPKMPKPKEAPMPKPKEAPLPIAKEQPKPMEKELPPKPVEKVKAKPLPTKKSLPMDDCYPVPPQGFMPCPPPCPPNYGGYPQPFYPGVPQAQPMYGYPHGAPGMHGGHPAHGMQHGMQHGAQNAHPGHGVQHVPGMQGAPVPPVGGQYYPYDNKAELDDDHVDNENHDYQGYGDVTQYQHHPQVTTPFYPHGGALQHGFGVNPYQQQPNMYNQQPYAPHAQHVPQQHFQAPTPYGYAPREDFIDNEQED
ncbi:SafA/ExsA family spore coat assembly protein [Evansella sp. AB-rgal1]|uniref:SafA/ExsA family spore coat assembly protein n=1 Tax=Evansella sp. AB-rgal1 TaxID=3242696 RepID=UPI00359CC5BF